MQFLNKEYACIRYINERSPLLNYTDDFICIHNVCSKTRRTYRRTAFQSGCLKKTHFETLAPAPPISELGGTMRSHALLHMHVTPPALKWGFEGYLGNQISKRKMNLTIRFPLISPFHGLGYRDPSLSKGGTIDRCIVVSTDPHGPDAAAKVFVFDGHDGCMFTQRCAHLRDNR